MDDAAPKIVVVVPTYHELDNLPTLVEMLAGLPLPNLHVLVVDDTRDGTGEVADKLSVEGPIPVGMAHRGAKVVWSGLCRRDDPGVERGR